VSLRAFSSPRWRSARSSTVWKFTSRWLSDGEEEVTAPGKDLSKRQASVEEVRQALEE